MAKKSKKDKKKLLSPRKRQLQWEKEQLRELRRNGPHIKALLRIRGRNPQFLDYIDSYAEEFNRVTALAAADHPTLLGVHEVSDEIFSSPEQHWAELGCGGFSQIFFTIGDEFADYGKGEMDANLAGATIAFHDPSGSIRTAILIKKNIPTSVQHADLKYALKVASLCHEIGHVDDIERNLNFKVDSLTLDIIKAESYAHLFALEMLAQRNLQKSYEMLADALKIASNGDGYLVRKSRRR